jgi:hypothetical protein
VRFPEVGAGSLLGIGEMSFLVPVEAVTQVAPCGPKTVLVNL